MEINKDMPILNDNIDIEKVGFDPHLFLDGTENEEDLKVVKEAILEYGIKNYEELINNINSNKKFFKDEDLEEDEVSHSLVTTESKEILDVEIIEEETDFRNEISSINKEYTLTQHKNTLNIHGDHNSQSLRNQLKTLRTFETDIANYHSKKNIDEYKANDQKKDLEKIENQSKNLLSIINKDKNQLRLWRYKEKYYCKVVEGVIVDNIEDGVTMKEIENKFKVQTKIVEVNDLLTPKTKNITQAKLYQYIMLNHIPVVTDIVFSPEETVFFTQDGAICKNKFLHTKYLQKRLTKQSRKYD